MSRDRGNSLSPVGTCTQWVGGRKRSTVCYGTFTQDIPDIHFRLRISTVEHEGDFPAHGHEYSELGVVLGGRAVHILPGHNHPLEAGDVFVIHGQGWHGFHAARQLKLCNIMFDPQQFFGGQRQLETMIGWQALFELGPRASPPMQERERLQLALPELTFTMGILTAMQEDYENRPEGWQVGLYGQFLILVTFLCRIYGRKTKEQTTPLLRFARVVSHIQEHLHEPLRLPPLAKLAHLSVRQFQREFQRVYNTTPVRFISRLRLREACERLKDPDSDVTSVAVDLGYSSVSFFSKQFKQATGLAPSEYRRRRLEELERQSRNKLVIESLNANVTVPDIESLAIPDDITITAGK
jgi:AraC-like DNA-binding protein/quercetin dioxygenase-like cupin family protein